MDRAATVVALFDDGRSRFGPLCDLRATFEQRLGALTCVERAQLLLGRVDAIFPPEHLLAILTERHAHDGISVGQIPAGASEVVLVNGALDCLGDATSLSVGEAIMSDGESVAMARLTRSDAIRALERGVTASHLPSKCTRRPLSSGRVVRAPWELLERLGTSVAADIAAIARSGEMTDRSVAGVHRFGHGPLLMDPTSRVLPGAVVDTTEGAVLLGPGVVVRPGAVICGPTAVLHHATVIDRALIKARSVLGPWCKVGGEVGSCVFQAYSNKAHDGHLGDALVGEWVNIGAGACNSNLLNTYGEVATRLDAAGSMERTGRQFYGGILGDHSKIGILVALTTGSTIGTGAMIAHPRPAAFVERFAWMTTERSQSYRFDRFAQAMQSMMARRGMEPGRAYSERLKALHGAHFHQPLTA
jgi:UDP-N-acetylglucosamine diphosphorylase/glucosamine-1-phosphate N-acetyltransferase